MTQGSHSILQSILVGLYGAVRRTGFFSTSLGRWMFEVAYDTYKERIEASTANHLRPYVRPGTFIIDVGANVGFFTRRFAEWSGAEGRVIAIEPESYNFSRLQNTLTKLSLTERVEPVLAVAAEFDGTLRLKLNPDHPGDHRIGTDASVGTHETHEAHEADVAAVAIDSLMAARGWPDVSFIKIDVQGAESRVIEGAGETLTRSGPALWVEIDDAALNQQGSSAAGLVTRLEQFGYRGHQLSATGAGPAMSLSEILELVEPDGAYTDLLFLRKNNPPKPAS